MSIKHQQTSSDFLEWNEALNVINKLEKDNETVFSLLFAVGIFTGLRISDIRELKWGDVLNTNAISIIENKTGKHRKIKLNENFISILNRIATKTKADANQYLIFGNKSRLSIQYINRKLKDIKVLFKLKIKNISTHTFRKSFGRHIWEIHNHSEKSLLLLSELFNHSSVAITKRYLGIKEQELQEIYDLL